MHINSLLKFLRQNKLFPILVVLAIIAIIISSFALRNSSVEVVAIIPANQTPNVTLTSPIVVTFSQALPTEQQVLFQLTPPLLGTVAYAQDRTKVTFSPSSAYQPEITYQLTVTSPNLKTFTSSFTTQGTSGFGHLVPTTPASSSNSPRLTFTDTLPYVSPEFAIRYLETSNTLDIRITALPYEDNKQKALDYIKSFGIDNPYTQFNISIDLDRSLNPNL